MAKEAKKNPQELTVEQKLKALYQLQTMLSKIDEIKTLRGKESKAKLLNLRLPLPERKWKLKRQRLLWQNTRNNKTMCATIANMTF